MSSDRESVTGPYDTLASVQSGMARGRVRGTDTLVLACAEVGVELGRFDTRVLDDLSQLDGESVWVLASIIPPGGRHRG